MNDLDLFAAAVAIPNPSERDKYLNRECEGRPEVRRRLDQLLAAHARSHPVLDRPVRDLNATEGYGLDRPAVGTVVAGRYKLLEEIGDGGMGTVWMAEQKEPVRRLVAVKLIKAGMDSKAVLARFEAERQALAMMDHPNIAKVHDAGTDSSGRPYFVMELVKGLPLTEYCDARKLSVNDRLDLFVQICSAVQHAHQKAIIHRDLKPTNVLVTEHDGKPVPKVIDFGLAKALGSTTVLTERTLHTAYGAVVGTPLYMAPEQVGINALDVDTRTDIYALGVILYELLTGSTPLERAKFKEAAWEEVKRLIREEEPPKPSTRLSSSVTLPSLAASRQAEPAQLRKLVRGELDWIVMKALDKDRSRRYETANGLSKDVQRYLKGEAVEACPPTVGYRLLKFYRRNRGLAVGAGAVAATLVAGLVATSYGLYRAEHERSRANAAEKSAVENALKAMDAADVAEKRLDEVNAAQRTLVAEQESRARADYGWSVQTAHTATQQYRFDAANSFLNRTRPDLRGWEWHYLKRECRGDDRFALRSNYESLMWATYSPDGRQIATVGYTHLKNGKIKAGVEVWDTATRRSTLLCEADNAMRFAHFHPDGRRLLVVTWEKASLWDLSTRTETVLFTVDSGTSFWDVRFSPDGKRVVSDGWGKSGTYADSEEIEVTAVWDVETRKRIWSHRRKQEVRHRISWSPDGRWILGIAWRTGSAGDDSQTDRSLRLWDAENGDELLEIKSDTEPVHSAALSPDGSRLTVTGYSDGAKVWRVRREGNRPVLDGEPTIIRDLTGTIYRATFSPDGTLLAAPCEDNTIRIWDLASGAQRSVLAGHSRMVNSPQFTPDGQTLLSASLDGTARVWPVAKADPQLVLRDTRRLGDIELSPSGDRIMLYTGQRVRGVFDVNSRRILPVTIPGLRHRFSPDGRRVAALIPSADRKADKIEIYDANDGKKLCEYARNTGLGGQFTFNADGSRLLIPGDSRTVTAWEIETGRTWEIGEGNKKGFAWAGYCPDGSKLFLERCGDEPTNQLGITILDGETYRPLIELECRPTKYYTWYRSFSRDGRKFMAYYHFNESTPNECRLWDTTTGKLLRTIPFSSDHRNTVELSPDGSRILVIDFDQRLRLLDADTGEELLSRKLPNTVTAKFDRTGHKIYVSCFNELRVLDGTPEPESKK